MDAASSATPAGPYARGSVSIVGCGWLGLPLARRLVAEGYDVRGTTTRAERLPEMEAAGVHAAVARLPLAEWSLTASAKTDDAPTATPDGDGGADGDDDADDAVGAGLAAVWQADQLVLTVPPGRDADAPRRYPAAILSAVLAYRRAQPSGRIVMTSSTGVYGRGHGLALDADTRPPLDAAPTERQAMLLLAESQVVAQSQRPYRVLRLGGLHGPGRDPSRWYRGRPVPRPDDPTNLCHLGTALDAIAAELSAPLWTGPSIYNVVDAEHPPRGEVYGGGV